MVEGGINHRATLAQASERPRLQHIQETGENQTQFDRQKTMTCQIFGRQFRLNPIWTEKYSTQDSSITCQSALTLFIQGRNFTFQLSNFY